MMHDSMAWMTAIMGGFFLLLISLLAAILVVGLRILERRPAPPSASPPSQSPFGAPEPPARASPPASEASPEAHPQSPLARPSTSIDEAALRLLDEDERRIYELVRARGGDVPQGDLVALSGYSKAKVSRVLDRLEAKALVVRLRRGMSNRVVLAPARAA